MAYLTLNNVDAKVETAAEAEHVLIDEYLTFEDPSARHTPAFQRKVWDGKVHVYKRRQGTFPAGLAGNVARALVAAGHPCTLDDRRTGAPPTPGAVAAWLDPARQQPQALAACYAATRGVVKAPTGSGKTEIIVALCATIQCPWLILVDMKDAMYNLVARYEKRTGSKAGLLGDGKTDIQRVTVATFQTLSRRLQQGDQAVLNLVQRAGGVISDEVHVLPAASWSSIMQQTTNAYWRFGFSATPLFGDARSRVSIIGHCGPQIYEAKAVDLLAAGVLAQHTIHMVPFTNERVTEEATSFAQVYWNAVVTSKRRNDLLIRLAKRAPKPCLLFVRRIEHGKRLMGYLRGEGFRADFLSGTASTMQRNKVVERLVRGDLDVLVGSGIFNKAWDIPELASAINGGGGLSIKDALQKLGRIMRISPGKGKVEFWDVDDQGITWLQRHAEQRRKSYNAEGYEISKVMQTDLFNPVEGDAQEKAGG